MLSLNQLTKKYGRPNLLIDSSSEDAKRYAVWGFEEIFEINIEGSFLNNQFLHGNPFELLQKFINDSKKTEREIACLGFLSYEFKNLIYNHISFNNKGHNDFPLLWFCVPKFIKPYSLQYDDDDSDESLKMVQDIIPLKQYAQKIDLIKSHLKEGNVYQVNFTSKKEIKSTFKHSFDLYNRFRSKIKPKEGFFLHTDKFDILSFSPELFIKINDGKIETMPIKGTRPRSSNYNKDLMLKNELINSEKDKAEHLMIVDLLRNDLGKICKTDSVKVKNLYDIQSFKTVHHMVTKVCGTIKNTVSETDIIKAMFPGGSITGAPKESAMKIIDELEVNNRDIYTGSAGYIASNGDMYFNICIRTLLKLYHTYEYGVGGGIVWDSNVADEWNEAHQKSKILGLS